MENIGIISPGKMGRSIGISLQAVGHKIFFPAYERTDETIASALKCGFTKVNNLHDISQICKTVICVGTGSIAFDTPKILFMDAKFEGLYIDLNSLNGEDEEKHWRTIIQNLTDNYVEGAIRGYPFDNIRETKPGTHLMLVSGDRANGVYGIFQNTIWSVQYSETQAKIVNRYMAVAEKAAENEPLYQDKKTPKIMAWEQSSLDLIADRFYVDGRTGAEAMIEIWQQINDGKLRNICAELGFPEHLGFIHGINRFGKNLTANKHLHKQRPEDRNVWHDPEVLQYEQNIA